MEQAEWTLNHFVYEVRTGSNISTR